MSASDVPGDVKVTVIIVTWNGRQHLEPCLDALAAQTRRDFEVVVVDNASTDGTVELLRERYPQVRLLCNEANLGFAVANNQGIRTSSAPFIATLNNDTIPDPGWLAALLRPFEADDADPRLGAVASKMVFADAPHVINSCGIAMDPAGIAWDLWGGRPAQLADRRREVFGACAGAALYRRAMLDDVGLFDEDFFAYFEDLDLAWRALLRGWRCVLAPDAVVRHAHSGTLGEGSPVKRYLLARNKVWVIGKNASADYLRRWWPVVVLYDVGAAAFGVARQGDWASVRGRLAGLRSLPSVLRKRHTQQEQRILEPAQPPGRAEGSALEPVLNPGVGRARPLDGSPPPSIDNLLSPLAPPWDVPRRYEHLVIDRTAPAPVHRTTGRGSAPVSPRERIRLLGLRAAGAALGRGRRRERSAVHEKPVPMGPERPLRVALIRPDHLGDVLLSRPAVEWLARTLPTSERMLVVGPWGAPSARDLPARVVTFPFPGFSRTPKKHALEPYGAMLALAVRLRAEELDGVVLLRPDHWWGAAAAALAGVPVRVGHQTPGTSPFLTHVVPEPASPQPATAQAMAAARLLAATLGATSPAADEPAVTFQPSARGEREAEGWLREHLPDAGMTIAIHPGAGADVKSWPARRWAEVVSSLRPPGAVVLSAGPGEEGMVHAIQDALTEPLPVAQNLSWDTLAALYRRLDLVLGMDSGPLHLAAAVGTRTVRVYGPTDAAVYGPAGPVEAHITLCSDLSCAPCGNLVAPLCGHRMHPPCLAAVSVDAVVGAARSLLPLTVAG
jgi:GT2 family glycosyltransferase/ADP-heptose:LPS heptosyltransferase